MTDSYDATIEAKLARLTHDLSVAVDGLKRELAERNDRIARLESEKAQMAHRYAALDGMLNLYREALMLAVAAQDAGIVCTDDLRGKVDSAERLRSSA